MKEQLCSSYFDALPVQAFVKDLDGKYLYVNQQFASTYGVAAGDVRQEGYTDSSFRDVTSTAATTFPVKNAKGETFAVGGFGRLPKVKENGTTAALDDDEKEGTRAEPLVVSSHPGDQIRQEEEEKEENKLSLMSPVKQTQGPFLPFGDKNLFTNMQMGATYNEIVTDENGNPVDFVYLAMNPAYEEITGLKEDEAIGKRFSEVLPGLKEDPTLVSKDNCGWLAQFGKVALEGYTWRFDREWCSGANKWVGGIAYRPSGEERRFVSLFLDVSKSVKQEEALRESEERHRNLFECMTQGVVYQEASGSIIAVNPSAERILGLTMDQMMGRTSIDPRWRSLREDGSDFPGDQHPAMVALKTGKSVTGAIMGIFHPKEEKHHWIVVDAIPRFRRGESEPYQVYATFTDMTQTKEFERKLMKEKERAEMADMLKSAFLANMSHEIRTPLNGVIGHIDLALSNRLCEELHQENLEGLNVARQSGELLLSIIQDILDLSKIEAGQLEINHDEHFQLRGLVGQVARLGETMIKQRKKTIRFELHVGGEIADGICGDPFRLQQVLNNLASNAIKFTDQGKVKLCVELLDNQMLQFTVRDTGKGVPNDHLESIFEPFRQVEIGDTRKHGGTGLGLTISKKLVEMMGGELSIVSSVEGPNKGSSFGFTFPYKRHSAASGAEASDRSLLTNQKHSGETKSAVEGRILVAEDEKVSRRLVKRMLELSGYEVILAEDGCQAVECFKSHNDIALILMDVQMPHMDGLEATSLIRDLESAHPDRSPTPIIALSAGAMKGDNERGLAVGMTAYMTKPVNFKLLKETLKKYLGER